MTTVMDVSGTKKFKVEGIQLNLHFNEIYNLQFHTFSKGYFRHS